MTELMMGFVMGSCLILLLLLPLIRGLNTTNNRLREKVYDNSLTVCGMTDDGPLTVSNPNFDLDVSGDAYTYYDTEADMDADPLKQRLEQQRDERLDRERDK